jgi:undecaprenyl pyrophosphate phosphatase UppP
MPFSHWLRIPPDVVLPAWWTWFILLFAVAIGLLYEVFEFRRWTDGKLNLPFFYLATVTPYFCIDLLMQFIQLDYHGLHNLYLICVGFSISFSLIRKVMKES